MKQRYGCLDVCVSSSTKSSVDSYLCVYVMNALKGFREARPEIYVSAHARSKVGTGVCMYVSVVFILQETATCDGVCMSIDVNTVD